MEDKKAKALANGIEVWCSFDELVPTERLVENPKNPNRHPEAQVELLAKNIKYFGWRHPVTVSKRSGFIVAGHGRLAAAKKLGVKIVPVDYQDFNSDAEETAVLVADNRLAELSETSEEDLKKILSELDGIVDLDLAGFSETEAEQLLRDIGSEEVLRLQLPKMAKAELILQAKFKNWINSEKENVYTNAKKRVPPVCDSVRHSEAKYCGRTALLLPTFLISTKTF